MKVIQVIQRPKLFHIYWHLTDFCNYKCNYCPSFLHDGDYHTGKKAGFPTNEQINNFLDLLATTYSPDHNVIVALGGGEPTLHPMFGTIVDRIAVYGQTFVTTNCSRSVEWWAALPTLPGTVNISLHHEFTKLDRVCEVSHFLIKSGVNLTYNLSCDPANWNNAVAMYNGLDDDLKCFVLPKIIHRFGRPMDQDYRITLAYTEQQKEWIRAVRSKFTLVKPIAEQHKTSPTFVYDDGSTELFGYGLAELTLSNNHVYTGWECDAGQKAFNINFDGMVYSSLCKQVKISHISEFKPLDHKIICQQSRCTAPGDQLVSKRKIN